MTRNMNLCVSPVLNDITTELQERVSPRVTTRTSTNSQHYMTRGFNTHSSTIQDSRTMNSKRQDHYIYESPTQHKIHSFMDKQPICLTPSLYSVTDTSPSLHLLNSGFNSSNDHTLFRHSNSNMHYYLPSTTNQHTLNSSLINDDTLFNICPMNMIEQFYTDNTLQHSSQKLTSSSLLSSPKKKSSLLYSHSRDHSRYTCSPFSHKIDLHFKPRSHGNATTSSLMLHSEDKSSKYVNDDHQSHIKKHKIKLNQNKLQEESVYMSETHLSHYKLNDSLNHTNLEQSIILQTSPINTSNEMLFTTDNSIIYNKQQQTFINNDCQLMKASCTQLHPSSSLIENYKFVQLSNTSHLSKTSNSNDERVLDDSNKIYRPWRTSRHLINRWVEAIKATFGIAPSSIIQRSRDTVETHLSDHSNGLEDRFSQLAQRPTSQLKHKHTDKKLNHILSKTACTSCLQKKLSVTSNQTTIEQTPTIQEASPSVFKRPSITINPLQLTDTIVPKTNQLKTLTTSSNVQLPLLNLSQITNDTHHSLRTFQNGENLVTMTQCRHLRASNHKENLVLQSSPLMDSFPNTLQSQHVQLIRMIPTGELIIPPSPPPPPFFEETYLQDTHKKPSIIELSSTQFNSITCQSHRSLCYIQSPSLQTISISKPIRFSWTIARGLIKVSIQRADTASLNGVVWNLWDFKKIPTLGASPTSCRVQEMFKVTIPPSHSSGTMLRVFVKSVPLHVWKKQWELQEQWNGEFVTDGENFVMEAAALAFLQHYAPHIAPRLLGIYELRYGQRIPGSNILADNTRLNRQQLLNPLKCNKDRVSHMLIVSELYGEDLLDFLERRENEKLPLSNKEKQQLQLDCLELLKGIHRLGLAHLDFTPENILLGPKGLKLCDFAKATPLVSPYYRHIHNTTGSFFPFESCEPTVGKGAYMPPECWNVYWRLEEHHVQYPLKELWSLATPSEREPYYFQVEPADVYMAGVLLFWLWSEGGIWKCSDGKQDEKYSYLVKSGLNFDLFRECRTWPLQLKHMLKSALRPEPWSRGTLTGLMQHTWFQSTPIESSAIKDYTSSNQSIIMSPPSYRYAFTNR